MLESFYTDGGYRSFAQDYYPWAASFTMSDEDALICARLEVYSEWLGDEGHAVIRARGLRGVRGLGSMLNQLEQIKGVPVEDRARLKQRILVAASRFFKPDSHGLGRKA